MKSYRFIFLILFVGLSIMLYAQPAERMVQVIVSPERADWLYKEGEKVNFKVMVLRCNVPVQNVEIRYEVSEDMMKA